MHLVALEGAQPKSAEFVSNRLIPTDLCLQQAEQKLEAAKEHVEAMLLQVCSPRTD